METDSLVYSSEELMQKLHFSKDLFWEKVHAGIIPAMKVSERKYIFSKIQIEKWLSGEQSQSVK